MYVKTSFFDVVHEDQKDLQDVSAGTGVFFIIYKVHEKFPLNFMSKSARSTLTLPGTIRVNSWLES
jgi:hypothetical protein